MLDAYDQKVLGQVARHIVNPGALVKLVELWSRPLDNIFTTMSCSKNPLVQKVQATVQTGISEGLKKMLKSAKSFADDNKILQSYHHKQIYIRTVSDIKNLHLEYIDLVADSFATDHVLLVGAEGAVMGAAATLASGTFWGLSTIPAIVAADVSLSLALLSRNVCQIGATYGYSVRNPLNMPHFMAALVSQQNLSEENYFWGKSMAFQSIYQSRKFLIYHAERLFDETLLRREAPQLLGLFYYVLQRLGMIVTEKELAMLLPAAGAVLNGSVNMAFQKLSQQGARDYFRMLFLEDKYGCEVVRNLLQTEVNHLRS